MYVSTVGATRVEPHAAYPPDRHPSGYSFSWENGRVLQDYQLVYITHGNGVLESGETTRRQLRAGDLFLLFPGVWHRYRPKESTGWHERWVGFKGEYAERLMGKGFFGPSSPVIRVGMDETLLSIYDSIHSLVRMESPGYQQLAAAATVQILARLHAVRFRVAGDGRIDRVIHEAKCMLVENVDREVDLEEVAGNLKVGYSWFRRMFRHYTGMSPHRYHLQLRMNKAQMLLSDTTYPVKRIAEMTGFECPYYFSRLFKKKMGRSPENWRRDRRGERRK